MKKKIKENLTKIFILQIIFLFLFCTYSYGENKYIEILGELPQNLNIKISEFRGFRLEYCVSCHDGIKETTSSHPLNWGCTVCHGGDGYAKDKETAHETLIYDENLGSSKKNPSALGVVSLSCGQKFCHNGHEDKIFNITENVKLSAMATQTKIISTIKHTFGETPSFAPLNEYLSKELQGFSDIKWKKSCSSCHLYSSGKKGSGSFRSEGCAACHFIYDEDGLYKGHDQTISKHEPGHVKTHEMTVIVPDKQCNICHKNSKTAISGTTYSTENPALKDVHKDAGLSCIDCHTSNDVMGDGNYYLNGSDQVEVKCRSCHAYPGYDLKVEEVVSEEDPVIKLSKYYKNVARVNVGNVMVLTEKSNKFTNVKIEGKRVVLYEKGSGKRHIIPQIRKTSKNHKISAHMEKLECTACHAKWVPQYFGGTNTFKVLGNAENGSKDIEFNESFKFKRLFNPSFGVNEKGKVSIFAPLFQLEFNALDERGNFLTAVDSNEEFVSEYKGFIFTTVEGKSSALAKGPVYPHSTKRKVRGCEECHIKKRFSGLGDIISTKGKGTRYLYDVSRDESTSLIPFDVMITEDGEDVASFGLLGARGFTKEELKRIYKVGLCIPCHDRADDPVFEDFSKSVNFSRQRKHKGLINNYLK